MGAPRRDHLEPRARPVERAIGAPLIHTLRSGIHDRAGTQAARELERLFDLGSVWTREDLVTAATVDPAALLRSPRYVRLLILAAMLGVPISAVAYGFLALVGLLQRWIYDDLPAALGNPAPPWWWAAAPLVVAGLIVGSVIRYLPGAGGHSPLPNAPSNGELSYAIVSALARTQEAYVETLTSDVWRLKQQVTGGTSTTRKSSSRTRSAPGTACSRCARWARTALRSTAGSAPWRECLPTNRQRLIIDLADQFDRVRTMADGEREYGQGVIEFYQTALTLNAMLVGQAQNEEVRNLTRASYSQNEEIKKISAWAGTSSRPPSSALSMA